MKPARVDPAGRPLENRRRQGVQALGIVLGWIVLVGLISWATGGPKGEGASVPWMLGLGALCWLAAEEVAGRRGLVWPGSALGIVGALSVGLAMAISTPDLRAGPVTARFAVIAGASALMMTGYLFRFRLPGLVSPVVTFTIVALFLGIYGADPVRLREVEGFSPRGILAAMLSNPISVTVCTLLSVSAVSYARRLDLKGDDFGLAAARPLHVAGWGVLGLLLGRWMTHLPSPADLAALIALWCAVMVWALRVNRIAVMFAAVFASAKPMMGALEPVFDFTFTRADWGWLLPLILFGGMAIWPWLHEQSLQRNWTLGPGGRIPQRRNNWWWRYWPYA